MTETPKVRPLYFIIPLLALSYLIFARVTGYEFINLDDPYLVQTNGDLVKPLEWATLLKPVAGLFHPLTNLTYWIDAHLFGMEAGPFHRTNLFFHLLGVFGIFLWIERLTGRVWAALVFAAAFAWHPAHVESVAWISERKDVVSVAFYFLALAAHAQSLRGDRRRWLLVCLGFSALSLLGKPFALTLPFVLLWIEKWKAGGEFRLKPALFKNWAFWLVSLAMSGVAGLLVVYSQGEVRAKVTPDPLGLLTRLPQQIYFYISKTVWPTDLKLLYTPADLSPQLLPALAVLAFLLISLYMAYRSKEFRKDFLFGLGFFFLTIGPMLKLVPFGDNTPVSDRYLYVSQTGLLWAWVMCMRPDMLRFAVAVPVLTAWAVLTWQRIPDWASAPAMWESMIRVDPDSADAHENLGRYYLGKEKPELALKHLAKGQTMVWDNAHNQAFVLMRMGRLAEAEAKLALVEKLVPNDPKVLNLRGNLYMEANNLEMAEAYFRKSLSMTPALLQDLVKAEAQTNIGVVEFRRKNYKLCVDWQNVALASLPGYVYAIHNRAVCNYLLRNTESAKADYEMTVKLEPGFAMAHNGLGAIALQAGKVDEAEVHFRNALKADPALPIARENLNRVLKMKGLPPQ